MSVARLKEDLILAIRSAAQPNRRDFAKGTFPGVFPVPLTLAGHLERWPFDTYHSGPIEVQVIRSGDGSNSTELMPTTFIDHVGLIVSADQVPGQQAYRLTVRRSLAHVVIAVVVVSVLVLLAVIALFVAIQTARNRRKFQPPMTT